jgi:hypothetical protein
LSERRIAPFGGEAVVKSMDALFLNKSGGRFAPKRGRAPSPQVGCLILKQA